MKRALEKEDKINQFFKTNSESNSRKVTEGVKDEPEKKTMIRRLSSKEMFQDIKRVKQVKSIHDHDQVFSFIFKFNI